MADRELDHYGWTSIILHWIGAAALVASFLTGEGLEGVAGDARQIAYANHVFWATLLAVPLIARIAWRMRKGFAVTTFQNRWLHLLSRVVMIGFLVSIFAAVLSGILLPWSIGAALDIGPVSIPSPMPVSRAFHSFLEGAHGWASHLWLPLLLLHVLGALKHGIIDRDGGLRGIFWPVGAAGPPPKR